MRGSEMIARLRELGWPPVLYSLGASVTALILVVIGGISHSGLASAEKSIAGMTIFLDPGHSGI